MALAGLLLRSHSHDSEGIKLETFPTPYRVELFEFFSHAQAPSDSSGLKDDDTNALGNTG